MKRLYIFDFDGVLADTGADIAAAVQAAQRHFGAPVLPEKEILRYVGYGARVLLANTVRPEDCREGNAQEIASWFTQYYRDHCVVRTVLYDGVRDTLEAIRQNGDLACLFTNKPEPVALRALELLSVRTFFSAVYCPENLTNRKPDPEGILKCMELLEAAPGEDPAAYTVMIGDSAADMVAGHAAGVHTCAFLFGIGDREKLLAEKPELCIETMRKVLPCCEAVLGKSAAK